MTPVHPPRSRRLLYTLLAGAVTAWVLLTPTPSAVRTYSVAVAVVSAVGVSDGIIEVASWYYVFESGILGFLGIGLVVMGYAHPAVYALTGGLAVIGLLSVNRYRRVRLSRPEPEDSYY